MVWCVSEVDLTDLADGSMLQVSDGQDQTMNGVFDQAAGETAVSYTKAKVTGDDEAFGDFQAFGFGGVSLGCFRSHMAVVVRIYIRNSRSV